MPRRHSDCDDSGEFNVEQQYDADDESDVDEGPDEHDQSEEDATHPCPRCRRRVWEDADRCAHCGYYLTGEDLAGGRYSPRQKMISVILLAAAVLMAWIAMRG